VTITARHRLARRLGEFPLQGLPAGGVPHALPPAAAMPVAAVAAVAAAVVLCVLVLAARGLARRGCYLHTLPGIPPRRHRAGQGFPWPGERRTQQ